MDKFPSLPKTARREVLEALPYVLYSPPTTLPCASVQAACKKSATMACSVCKLVSYCSKECQKAHWKKHKLDCKSSMRSPDWQPIWMREDRRPSFLTDEPGEGFRQFPTDEFSLGMSLWGNTPAVDVISLTHNKNDPKKDFNLAFIASGDLRNVLRTFNALPEDYLGHLNFLVNDFNPFIFTRNLVLLLILGNVADEGTAADMALHFWYSAFIPANYHFQLSMILARLLLPQRKDGVVSQIPLGPCSAISTSLTKETATQLAHFMSEVLSMEDIQNEYDRVRTAPSRRDLRDRMYASLKPSHGIAFQEYRRFGIVLPFGAPNDHFNCPNLSLFSPLNGKWMLRDYADPLEGWDIPTIVDAGKAYGAPPEDIYGCLYFFLSQQLRMLARRLRKFSSSFTMLNVDARILPCLIHAGAPSELNIPSSIKFDRIDVSNILDNNYVGLRDVLTLWGPLLEHSGRAAIVGYFMNWPVCHKSGCGASAGKHVMAKLLEKVSEKEKVKLKGTCFNSTNMQATVLSAMDSMEAFYENSKPFLKFLQKQGLDNLLKRTSLRLRDKHTLVPHRILAPLGGSPRSLPEFPDDDTWYYYTKLTSFTWSERYVEFERI